MTNETLRYPCEFIDIQKSKSAKILLLVIKALDTLEDPGSSTLSYRLQVIKGVIYYVPKKSQLFGDLNDKS
jgi:hypothetical protein